MDSTGLFMSGLNKIMRESSIPQTPKTPNITRNISELSLLSQGNSHFVPYNAAASEYSAPPTPSKQQQPLSERFDQYGLGWNAKSEKTKEENKQMEEVQTPQKEKD